MQNVIFVKCHISPIYLSIYLSRSISSFIEIYVMNWYLF